MLVTLLMDEEFQQDARKYIVQWMKKEWKTDICEKTARRWFHKMGFTYHQYSKGVYFDGHERADVVVDRKEYLAVLAALDSQTLSSVPQSRLSHSFCSSTDPIKKVIP